MDNKPQVGIKNLWLASFLMAQKMQLVNVRINGNQTIFYFEGNPALDKLIQEYYHDEALVNLRRFRNCLYDLKKISAGEVPFTGTVA